MAIDRSFPLPFSLPTPPYRSLVWASNSQRTTRSDYDFAHLDEGTAHLGKLRLYAAGLSIA
jgi:hypothetical protein